MKKATTFFSEEVNDKLSELIMKTMIDEDRSSVSRLNFNLLAA